MVILVPLKGAGLGAQNTCAEKRQPARGREGVSSIVLHALHGASPYLLVSAIKYVGGEWSVAGGGRCIVETMAALEGLESLIREKIEQDQWSHAQLSDFLKLSYPGVQGFSIRSLQRFCQEKNIHKTSRVTDQELDEAVSNAVSKVCSLLQHM